MSFLFGFGISLPINLPKINVHLDLGPIYHKQEVLLVKNDHMVMEISGHMISWTTDKTQSTKKLQNAQIEFNCNDIFFTNLAPTLRNLASIE